MAIKYSEARSGPSRHKRMLICTVFGPCGLVISTVALAQDVTPGGTTPNGQVSVAQKPGGPLPNAGITGVEDIVVTARKRAEKNQDIPLTVTALSRKDLQAAGATSLRDVSLLTPGLVFKSNGAEADETPIIRGQADLNIGIGDNNVPTFFDGVAITNASAIDFGFIDLARIEVIEGPVSALYGRSAYAGAINYVTAKPLSELGGDFEFTVGNYGKENVKLNTSGPIVPGVLAGGISGSYDTFDGTFHDNRTGQNAGGDEKKDVFGQLDFTPNEHVEIRPEVYYGDDFFADAPTRIGQANCGVPPFNVGFNYTRTFCGNVANGSFQGPFIANPGDYGTTGNSRNVLVANVQAQFTYDWGTVTSISGFNNIRSTSFAEFDNLDYGVPVPTYFLPPGASLYTTPGSGFASGKATGNTILEPVHFGYDSTEKDISEELRFTSPQNQRFRYSLAGYVDRSFRVQDLVLSLGTEGVPAGQFIESLFAVPPGVTTSGQQTYSKQEDRTAAIFGSFDVDILHDLTFSAEARLNSTTSTFQERYAIAVPYGVGYSTAPASRPDPLGLNPESKTFVSGTSRSTLTYKVRPGFIVYASAANGEKPGGFNPSIIAADQAYNPETNWTYEAGLKTTWLDNRVLFNADYFHIDAQNYQISAPAQTNVLGNFITKNFGSVITNGVEALTQVSPMSGVKLTTGVAYSDPQFGADASDFADVKTCSGIASCKGRIDTVGKNTAISLRGLTPPGVSKVTLSVSLALDYPVTEHIRWFGRGDYRFESSKFYQYPIDTGSYGPLNNLNLRTGLSYKRASLTLFVDNVTDDLTPINVEDEASTGSIYNFYQSGYYPVQVLPEGRTFGATFRYSF